MRGVKLVAFVGLAANLSAAALQNEPRIVPSAQAPVFRSTVDLIAVDVQVVSRDGHPVDTLGIDDFHVRFNGRPRRVVSVDFVRKRPPPAPEAGGPERPIRTPGFVAPGARLYILAVDTGSLAPRAMKPVVRAAQEFLGRLEPDDMAGLYVYPFDRPTIDLTHDRYAVSRALDRVTGQFQPFGGAFQLSLSEAIDISANDGDVLTRVAARECVGEDPGCRNAIHLEAKAHAAYYEALGVVQLRGVSLLLDALATLPGRKTVVLLSGGLPASDRVGGRPNLAEAMMTIGAEAGQANANIYVVHVDNSFFDPFSVVWGTSKDPSARVRRALRDGRLLGIGLDRLAGASGGALLADSMGTGALAFDRVLRETSGYYLVGVQPMAEDRDGKLHYLRVDVRKRGLTVRSRTHVVIPRS